jgi:8-amino-7-oxononanoate synthase
MGNTSQRMSSFDQALSQRLVTIRGQGLYRELQRIDSPQSVHILSKGRSLLNFSSNDYLGLANEPALKAAAIEAVQRYGAGTGASRLICGSLAPHHELDETLARFKGTEAALSFSTGYTAAIGVICALLNKDDIIIVDRLVHASIVDAARLSGARLRVFAHNDLNSLEKILKWTKKARGGISETPKPGQGSRVLVVTESVFSMDGDQAPLRELVELKERYDAWLMVDEAHATGLYGQNRRGLAEALGVSNRIEIQMGTLGKALGASGGYLCGSHVLIDYLVNRARTFIFSTGPVPAAAAAATAGIRFVQSGDGADRLSLLWQRIAELPSFLNTPQSHLPSAIIPISIGDETKAVQIASALRDLGIYIPAIRYPTVPRGQARLRLTMTAGHSGQDIAKLVTAFGTRCLNHKNSDLESRTSH